MEHDTPAHRLYALLEQAMKIPKDQPCRAAWSQILHTKDNAQLMARLGAVMALPQAVVDAIEDQHPGTGRHHAHWVNQLSAAFGQQNLEGTWNSFRSNLHSQTLSAVMMAATSLAGRVGSRQLSADDVGSLREQIDTLGNTVREVDLPPDVRNYLLQQVKRLRAAIDEYWLSGSEPIANLVDATMGHLGMNATSRDAMATPGGRKVVSVLAVLADAVTVANGLPPLLTAAGVPFLEWAKNLLPTAP